VALASGSEGGALSSLAEEGMRARGPRGLPPLLLCLRLALRSASSCARLCASARKAAAATLKACQSSRVMPEGSSSP